MNYNYISSRGKSALDETSSALGYIVIILFFIAIFAAVAGLVFWVFTWAVATLFGIHIAFTFINWVAFVVLSWIFGRGGSTEKKD